MRELERVERLVAAPLSGKEPAAGFGDELVHAPGARLERVPFGVAVEGEDGCLLLRQRLLRLRLSGSRAGLPRLLGLPLGCLGTLVGCFAHELLLARYLELLLRRADGTRD